MLNLVMSVVAGLSAVMLLNFSGHEPPTVVIRSVLLVYVWDIYLRVDA